MADDVMRDTNVTVLNSPVTTVCPKPKIYTELTTSKYMIVTSNRKRTVGLATTCVVSHQFSKILAYSSRKDRSSTRHSTDE